MQWDRRERSRADKIRETGLILLAAGVILLASGIVLTFTIGTVMAPVFMSGSIFINTAAIICLRQGRRLKKGDKA